MCPRSPSMHSWGLVGNEKAYVKWKRRFEVENRTLGETMYISSLDEYLFGPLVCWRWRLFSPSFLCASRQWNTCEGISSRLFVSCHVLPLWKNAIAYPTLLLVHLLSFCSCWMMISDVRGSEDTSAISQRAHRVEKWEDRRSFEKFNDVHFWTRYVRGCSDE